MTDRTHMQHSSWQSTTSLNMSKGSISSYDAGPTYEDDEEDGEASKLQLLFNLLPMLALCRGREKKVEEGRGRAR